MAEKVNMPSQKKEKKKKDSNFSIDIRFSFSTKIQRTRKKTAKFG